jgi:heptosyltransferase-2
MPLKLPSKPKILIVRFSSLGDVTLSTLIPPALKTAYPGARLTFLTKKPYEELLAFVPELDEILTLSSEDSLFALAGRLRSQRFDLIVDLHGNLRSRILCSLLPGIPHLRAASQRWRRLAMVWFKYRTTRGVRPATVRYAEALRPLGGRIHFSAPKLTLDGSVAPLQERLGLKTLPRPLIGFCVSSQHNTKRWNDDAARQCVMNLLASTGGSVVLVGTRGSDESVIAFPSRASVLNLIDKTSLQELAATLSLCSVLVTVDSGPLHIAEALGVPVVALFGPTVSDFGFAPLGGRSQLIERALHCRPCSLHGSDACPLGHHHCMKDITPQQVATGALALLAGSR